ncbi:MAG: bifunctional [glutamate--ammonia ligase]-adenylyl-L-tyrosine phosphorylase/[glutamate--ammonia-ligase] adenylyltransferase [Pseudomonadota bacterium]
MRLATGDLPSSLAAAADTAWDEILKMAGRTERALSKRLQAGVEQTPIGEQLARVLATSPFVAELLRRHPTLLLEALDSGLLQRSLKPGEQHNELQASLAAEGADLHRVLRQHRQRHMLRILWRDFCRLADTLETVRDTSALADSSIQLALDEVQRELEQRHGVPLGRDSGAPQQLIVIALGKLGAAELNVSSDIDLMFAFPESGDTRGGATPLSNEEFFTRVGRRLIESLDKTTADGFVFRVDMRLRPYGDSGALVHSNASLEAYYQDQGRDWERYALIKARPVTGNPAQSAALMATLRPFVYRRYVDYSVIESLRSMKEMIAAEVRRKGLEDNIKLGPGGIREVEFIAQCFQLIRGGRDHGLQQPQLLPALAECARLGCLPHHAVDELRSAYLFLRDSEHALQGYLDRQTQTLPKDDLGRLSLAVTLGFADWGLYSAALSVQRERVAEHFRALIARRDDEAIAQPAATLPWGDDLAPELLAGRGFRDALSTFEALQNLKHSRRVLSLAAEGRDRLERFMPRVMQACVEMQICGEGSADLALTRLLPLVSAVVRRSAYLVLLLENPNALQDLVRLSAASPWIAEQMSRHPVLLDELLDHVSLFSAPDRGALRDELRQRTARLEQNDLEAQMDALRYFKAAHVLRVAVSEVSGRLPLMAVSDKLTLIAEVILEQVLAVAWADLASKYGEPARAGDGLGFAVFAYGKMGGIELGYGSDLDLVFLHDAEHRGVTDGERSIDNSVFFTRLGQRMVQIMEARTVMGLLYEVDLRLRPSGESGMLVVSVQGFETYQLEAAWTWEHQALVRARFVAGDPEVAAQVDRIRRRVLCLPRDEAALRTDVAGMRTKMREHLLPQAGLSAGEFDLKQGGGGIVDIEFMVQYAVLAWSHREPELARWSDNVRILEALGREGLFEQQECDALTSAYLAFRSAAHQLSLQQQPAVVSADDFVDSRAAVCAKWNALFGR